MGIGRGETLKFGIKIKKRKDGSYYFEVLNDELREIFENLAKYGYAVVENSKIPRVIGNRFRDLRRLGVFMIGKDWYLYSSIIAISPDYTIKKDKEERNGFLLKPIHY